MNEVPSHYEDFMQNAAGLFRAAANKNNPDLMRHQILIQLYATIDLLIENNIPYASLIPLIHLLFSLGDLDSSKKVDRIFEPGKRRNAPGLSIIEQRFRANVSVAAELLRPEYSGSQKSACGYVAEAICEIPKRKSITGIQIEDWIRSFKDGGSQSETFGGQRFRRLTSDSAVLTTKSRLFRALNLLLWEAFPVSPKGKIWLKLAELEKAPPFSGSV